MSKNESEKKQEEIVPSQRNTKQYFVIVLPILLWVILIIFIAPINNHANLPQLLTRTPTTNSNMISELVQKTEVQPDGSIKTIFELSSDPITTGQAILIFPQNMKLGDSEVVRLIIKPKDRIEGAVYLKAPNNTYETKNLNSQSTSQVDIYPVMQVDLSATGFEISEETNSKVFTTDDQIEWVWTITPKEVGKKQVIICHISTPVYIDGTRESDVKTLVTLDGYIDITNKPITVITWVLLYVIGPLVILLAAYIGISKIKRSTPEPMTGDQIQK